MPAHKGGDVERDCDPEDADEARFTRLVAQQLLCEQRAGPAASQGKEMQCLFGGAPALGNGRRLVEGVGHERREAETQIGQEHRWTKAPAPRNITVDRCKDRNHEQLGQGPGCGRLCSVLSLRTRV